MKERAKVVVVGGGIGGCSALYHLTREGWTDVVLVEAHELTSGTTWHSAAQCPNLAFNQLLLGLRSETIALYKELSEDPDYPINYHHAVGGLRLITDQEQLDACQHIISVAKGMGVSLEIISPEEAVERNPLLDTDDVIAALWDPVDGDIDPAQLCQALARRSRNAGAEIYRFNPVTGLTQQPNHEWIVHTKQGDIACEHVINAGGYRVNEIGAMLGIEYPVVSMEHMYFVTEPVEELIDRENRVAMVRCPRDTFYMRQEKDGLLVGVYEHECKTFGLDGVDPDFVNALCPDDLDRCLPKLGAIFERLPCLQEVGIKSIINGPITYTADAGPLVGHHPGKRNLWSMNGLRVGIGEGGGYGKMLAQMMVHGEAQWDTWQLDPRRLGDYATQKYTALKAIEDYQHEFRWHMPHEHRPAGRPARATPLYLVLKAQGAEFGTVNGWERASFFKPTPDFHEEHSYHFTNWHEVVGREVEAVRTSVGVAEISGFNRYEIRGADARDWLDSLMCSRVPKNSGKVGLCYFLTEQGNVLGEATLALVDDEKIWWGSAAAAELHDMDWLTDHLPTNSDIQIKSLTNAYTTLVIAGPKSRELLQTVCPAIECSREEFPWMSVRSVIMGDIEAVVMSVSYSGELAYELHIPNPQLEQAYEILMKAGEPIGITPFGGYAIESMRLEKGYGHWKSDFITEFNPIEAGLDFFVDVEKQFVGKKGLQTQIQAGLKKHRVLLTLDCDTAPAQPGEPVFRGNEVVGTITSAGWGHRTNQNIAMAYILPEFAKEGTKLECHLLAEKISAAVCGTSLYDPQNLIPRG